ncbi:hypothetical protein [Fibrella arboris]|uniref:hypothetical protein n=1 Tax=Fibrella arboris TaxID=3242486 RepID=UPI0035201D55
METVQQELTAEERHERLVAFLKRHMEEKRRFEQEMVEDAKARKKARQQAGDATQH